MKTWKPDTCECHVEEIYDGSVIVGMGRVLRKCEAHRDVPDEELYGVLYANPDGENKRKNIVLRVLLGYEEIRGLGLEEMKYNPDGTEAGLGLKVGIEYRWSFSGTGKDRILQVEVRGGENKHKNAILRMLLGHEALTGAKKDSIRTLCNKKFGAGKVEIV